MVLDCLETMVIDSEVCTAAIDASCYRKCCDSENYGLLCAMLTRMLVYEVCCD